MTGKLIVPRIGGFVRQLSERARAEIQRLGPVDMAEINKAFEEYNLYKSANDQQPEAAYIARRFAKLEKLTKKIVAELEWLNDTNLGIMLQQVGPERGHPDLFYSLPEAIRHLHVVDTTLPYVREYLPEGNKVNLRHWLTARVAWVVENAGLTVDVRPQGPVCLTMEILLKEAGEDPTSVVEIVKPVVRKIMKNKARTEP